MIMRGEIKLLVNGKRVDRTTYSSKYHRDVIIQDWITDHGLNKKTYKILITPDYEEIEKLYVAERSKKVYRGRFKPRPNPGTGRKQAEKEERSSSRRLPAGPVDVGPALLVGDS